MILIERRKKIAITVVCTSVLSATFILTSLYRAFAADLKSGNTKQSGTTTTTQVQGTKNTETTTTTKPTQPTQAGKVDISTLSPNKIGWGQGTNFDDLNRPQDAVTAQERYGNLGGNFVDLSGKKIIYLTFDEGYENGYTNDILDTLKKKNVKATFFITGDYAKREGELVQRMIDEGHTVGNHTWRHYSMPEKTLDTCREEISELDNYVQENFHYKMNVMRPPMGEFSEQTLALCSEMGYQSYFWSFAYKDWDVNSQSDPSTALKKLNDRLHPGAIYLLHAVSSTNAEILADFVDCAQKEGYKFVVPAEPKNQK